MPGVAVMKAGVPRARGGASSYARCVARLYVRHVQSLMLQRRPRDELMSSITVTPRRPSCYQPPAAALRFAARRPPTSASSAMPRARHGVRQPVCVRV